MNEITELLEGFKTTFNVNNIDDYKKLIYVVYKIMQLNTMEDKDIQRSLFMLLDKVVTQNEHNPSTEYVDCEQLVAFLLPTCVTKTKNRTIT